MRTRLGHRIIIPLLVEKTEKKLAQWSIEISFMTYVRRTHLFLIKSRNCWL